MWNSSISDLNLPIIYNTPMYRSKVVNAVYRNPCCMGVAVLAVYWDPGDI